MAPEQTADGTAVMTSAPAAATVLHQPDADMLDALVVPLEADGLRLFIFVNGALEPEIEHRLANLANAAIIRSPENVGLGAGLNAVVEAAAAEGFSSILLFDQDSAPERGMGAALLTRFKEHVSDSTIPVATIGPRLISPANEAYLAPWYLHRSGDGVPDGAVDFLPTSGSLVSIEAWTTVGAFRADYFIDGIDVEWCFRAWSCGYCCVLAENVTMAHRWGDTDTSEERRPQILRLSPTRCYYYLRNAVHSMGLPHLPWRWRLRTTLRIVGQACLLLLDRRFDRQTRRLIQRAFHDGWHNRLGRIPEGIS
jgi:rhamnosyltransferase